MICKHCGYRSHICKSFTVPMLRGSSIFITKYGCDNCGHQETTYKDIEVLDKAEDEKLSDFVDEAFTRKVE